MRQFFLLLAVITVLSTDWAIGQALADTTNGVDSTEGIVYKQRNKEPIDWRPRAIRVGWDLAGLSRLAYQPNLLYTEGAADLQIHTFHLVAEGGFARVQYIQANPSLELPFVYTMQGSFGRVGLDYNLLGTKFGTNGIFAGFRYGYTSFRDQIFVQYDEPLQGWPDFAPGQLYDNRNARAQWWEAVATVKAQVWEGLHLGYSVRYHFGYRNLTPIVHRPYAAPGVGRIDVMPWYVNVHLQWSIPLAKPRPAKPPGEGLSE